MKFGARIFRCRILKIALALCCHQSIVSVPILGAPREEHFRIAGYPSSIKLFLRHLPPTREGRGVKENVVLFVHGATFPSASAAAFRFDGHSWMDDLSAAGFDVWALDFAGYGGSDRYPEMSVPSESNPPLGRAEICSRQLAAAIDFIRAHRQIGRVSIIAHSWGTLAAGLYATQQPEKVGRLVLFGPPAMRHSEGAEDEGRRAWWCVTEEAQQKRFYGYVPPGERPVMDPKHFAIWGPAYLETDADSFRRSPPCVRVPNGPVADLEDSWHGRFVYDPAKIESPVLIIRGEWDTVTTYRDAQWLYQSLRSAPIKRDVVISRGTHVMHLEQSRFQLYREVQTFLEGHDGGER
ncbi:MAG TPA: alpha/beta fold hydrolase [Blastocatellia bacterium]|nr:alpha/beta fold hydrolase [Blastocatellia bacterium]